MQIQGNTSPIEHLCGVCVYEAAYVILKLLSMQLCLFPSAHLCVEVCLCMDIAAWNECACPLH